MKRLILLCLFGLLAFATSATEVQASYNYNDWSQPVPSKDGYAVREQGTISGTDLDITLPGDEASVHVTGIADLFVTEAGYYIIDQPSARIVLLSRTFDVEQVLGTFDHDGTMETFENPRGLYVTEDGELYVTDFDREEILVFDDSFTLINVIGKPDHPTYGDREFKVDKIVLDRTKRIYVTVGNVYDGIVELTSDGQFSRFFGVQPVQTNPIDLIWRRFMTQEQLSRTVLFLPVEYTNLAIDPFGFIYATATSESQTPIQRLNPKGTDVLRRNGYVPPTGDVDRLPDQDRSNFIAVTVNDYGMYSVLDRANRKIFTYNDEGYLIYVTGEEGEFEGMFRYPTAIAYDDELLLVTDSERNTITVFEPTSFGAMVNEAIARSYRGDYLDITELWEAIIEENANFSYAYVGIGNALYRAKDYEGAMEAYRLGVDKEGYGKAYEQYRKIVLRDNFPIIGFAMVGVIGFTVVRPIVKDIRKGD
jgi:hypothetical protein